MNAHQAAKEFLDRVTELASEDSFGPDVFESIHALRARYVDPLCGFLSQREKYRKAAEDVMGLQRAIEELVFTFEIEPDKRQDRRDQLERCKVAVRRVLVAGDDRESEVQELLADVRRWQWRTRVDARGRIVFATPSGARVPAKGDIATQAGPKVIEMAAKAQRPYADSVRPRDRRGQPGGLVIISEGQRLVVVGDLHGRYENLERILKDRNNLASIIDGDTQLVFTGDAIHPPSSLYNDDDAYNDSFAVMMLIMTLKAENPDNIHYVIGNHDNAHVGGEMAGRGSVRQDTAFEKFITDKFGEGVLERYRQFVARSPLALKANFGSHHMLLLHATVPHKVHRDSDLTDILIEGRRSKKMRDLLWSRQYDDETLDNVAEGMGVKLVVSGHTTPQPQKMKRYGLELIAPPVFAHYKHRQIIVNAQTNRFGYLDLDLTQEMPAKVSALRAPGGKAAFRVISRRAKMFPSKADEE